MDYLDFYGLTQEPFSVMPLNKFYYHSEQHDRALEKLQYAVSTMKGLAVLVGDLGTGKTTLARRLLDSLPEDEYEASLLVMIHSDVDATWLLKRVASQLGVLQPAAEKVDILSQLLEHLITISESGKKAVILIDEAQMLKRSQLMEELRGLLNLELPEKKLLSFVFFGLPELEECLKADPPLQQRIAVKHKLLPFMPETTMAYIHHRLSLAGRDEPLFDGTACALVHLHSKGIPRLINVICDNALFEGYIRKSHSIGEDIIENVVMDLSL
ncbi:MAG: AAA family ATPase [Deltaproteobacteria bacterium]|nr:AAA family ATPase [Deltaproteobacteria bacterium]MBI2341377.1 AAA family ATPase [Deltaproteobacteria bacterium]